MANKFIKKNGELKDKKIIQALKNCIEAYQLGEIAEVGDVLFDIVEAIQQFKG